MRKTRLCRLLGIEYPIIQAGMAWISNAELAAAVSGAGGLGVISPTAGMALDGDAAENLRGQIRQVMALTGKPFGVSLFLASPDIGQLLEVVVEEGVRIVVTAGASPAPFMGSLKERDIQVLHLVASIRHARGADAHGVDAVIAEGYEGGGLRGHEAIPSLVLVPQVVEAVEIPVIASGGIVDARGLVAALALGAQGVCMGTRFVATHECIAHPRYKEAIIKALDTSTAVVEASRSPVRVLKAEGLNKLLRQRGSEGTPVQWEDVLSAERVRAAYLEGDLSEGIAYCGASAGLVTEMVSAAELVSRMVQEADALMAKLR